MDLLKEQVNHQDILKDSEGTVRLINRQHHFLYSSVFCPFGQEGDLPDDQTIDNTLATYV
ncbi:hypothetical protein K4R62_11180 [Staphylococcus epidermidis]|uniref:hypothetical protein n=1 Tax=Staphylococcus TaxID=1279 RepID=UPI0007353D9A|nr:MULTISPECIES: hypothetical protein [Staphylococcus]HCD8274056.1 hypothetical protein [Staphylococcus aureus]MCC3696899.1 hypothetical protein [Staphylococcus epidermidis]MCG1455407.1 hypothetical protein [Staphylococcus epidermidis]MCG1491869.1 hypothetical protein [Staphylococcus epidermidis]MCG1700727.1 hypothetical protein [Staphylococcus epidermidis]